jgi:hypothetical protein
MGSGTPTLAGCRSTGIVDEMVRGIVTTDVMASSDRPGLIAGPPARGRHHCTVIDGRRHARRPGISPTSIEPAAAR